MHESDSQQDVRSNGREGRVDNVTLRVLFQTRRLGFDDCVDGLDGCRPLSWGGQEGAGPSSSERCAKKSFAAVYQSHNTDGCNRSIPAAAAKKRYERCTQ